MNQNTTAPPPTVDGAFLRAMQGYRHGETLTALGEALRKVTEAVTANHKAGSVTLKIVITPTGNAISFQADVTTKAPQIKPPASIFFADDQFNLVREDPHQTEMQLRTVEPQGQQQAEPLRQAVAQ